jgi:alanyl-tRNA synthetase
MTNRVYYDDSYLIEFEARVVAVDGNDVFLDRTAFYPTSGGQPFDTGSIGGVPVVDVIDEDTRVRHRLAAPLAPGTYSCRIDWSRRFDHMQQHTGQHLLSAILDSRFGFPTLSVHFGDDSSTIDIDAPALSPSQILEAERIAAEIVFENRPVSVSYHDSSDPTLALRKPAERTGNLRIITIAGIDRSACGGTHVRSTAEIGPIQIRRLDRVRSALRVEFLCGHRALRRARSDFDSLTRIARVFSSSLDDAPALVENQRARLVEAEKSLRKLTLELAAFRGRELYNNTPPLASGLRLHVRRMSVPLSDELRAEAQAFTQLPSAAFLLLSDAPPAVLLALSAHSPWQAGALLQPLLAAHGGRGGGNPQIAQGSLPSPDALAAVESALLGVFSS